MVERFSEEFFAEPLSFETSAENYRLLYDDEFINSLIKRLNVPGQHKENIYSVICVAAYLYEVNKITDLKKGIPFQQKLVKLRKFSKACDNFIRRSNELFENERMCTEFYWDKNKGLLFSHGNPDFYYNKLPKIIKILSDTSTSLEKKTLKKGKLNFNQYPLHQWVKNLSHIFDYSQCVKFQTPKYLKEINSYVSSSLDILEEIMRPLDKAITRKQIAEQMKIYNKKRIKKAKTHYKITKLKGKITSYDSGSVAFS